MCLGGPHLFDLLPVAALSIPQQPAGTAHSTPADEKEVISRLLKKRRMEQTGGSMAFFISVGRSQQISNLIFVELPIDTNGTRVFSNVSIFIVSQRFQLNGQFLKDGKLTYT